MRSKMLLALVVLAPFLMANQCDPPDPAPNCGNSVVDWNPTGTPGEPGEQCDDGNIANGDGCSNQCVWESPNANQQEWVGFIRTEYANTLSATARWEDTEGAYGGPGTFVCATTVPLVGRAGYGAGEVLEAPPESFVSFIAPAGTVNPTTANGWIKARLAPLGAVRFTVLTLELEEVQVNGTRDSAIGGADADPDTWNRVGGSEPRFASEAFRVDDYFSPVNLPYYQNRVTQAFFVPPAEVVPIWQPAVACP